MPNLLLKLTEHNIFSFLFISALTAALFYTGNNTWLFSASYILIVLCISLVLKQRFYKSINISVNGIFISASLLLVWFATSILPSQIKYLSLYNFFWLGSLIVVFLIFTVYENKDQLWKHVWPAIFFLALIWAFYGLVQYYYLRISANASFLNRNSLAALINLTLIPASGYLLIKETDRPWKFLTNKFLTLALLILFLTTFIIASRGASLSLIIGFTILLSLLRNHVEKSKIYSLFIITFISFMFASLSQYFIPDLPYDISERMASLKSLSSTGNARFIIWESLIPLFKEMPWSGFGLGSLWMFWPPHRSTADTSAGFFAHNDYMQITLEAGYPGILFFISLFLFIFLYFIQTIKSYSSNINAPTSLQRVELISIFSALTTFATHSFFTYNFYILSLLLISGLYLGRFNQIININVHTLKTLPSFNTYFKPYMFYLSLAGFILILISYFFTVALSNHYNNQAKELMLNNKYQNSNVLFLKAQTLAPLMDNPFFSHAELLRRGAEKLYIAKKFKQANSLIKLAHANLDKAQKLNPLRPQIHHIRALIYLQNEPAKAKLELQKALKLDPRFLFSRIQLAKALYKEENLNQAVDVLYKGIDYSYPINKVMLDYMRLSAKFSLEVGNEHFAEKLKANIKKFIRQNKI